MIAISLVPIPSRIAGIAQEQKDLLEYPAERLAAIIREVRFRCTCCARCCTREFNGHVFLLDNDVAAVRAIDPAALEPAPYPEFCDQNGTFYVSGYALRAKDDEAGSCWFLEEGRCRIYDNRFSICRIYPYMLHREPDETGKIDWRQISGLELHGEYDRDIPEPEAMEIAKETIDFENAFLVQEIAFLEYVQKYFSQNHLRHVQKVYDDRMRAFKKGHPLRVMVFCEGRFEEHTVQSA